MHQEKWREVCRLIDHTCLDPAAGQGRILGLCREALHYSFASVCVPPVYVRLAAEALREGGGRVACGTVIGFPHGTARTSVKRFEAERALQDGARELDMVLPIGLLCDGDFDAVQRDIESVLSSGAPVVKVILETGLLSGEQVDRACQIAERAGAHYVKTSTGFGPRGATVEDVHRMRLAAPSLKIKAAGGIHTWEQACKLIEAGAARLGCSRSVAIIEEGRREGVL